MSIPVLAPLTLCAALAATPSVLAGQQVDAIDYETARFERKLIAVRAAGPITVDGVVPVPHAEVPRRRSADVGAELRAKAAAAERGQLLVPLTAHLRPRARVAGRHDANVIHRPLSDFFLVYNEGHDEPSGGRIDRALIAKMTYLVAF